MADDPISTTPTLALGQWGDKKNPGFEALNANWEAIDTAIGALQSAVALKSSQSDMSTVQSAVTALQAAIVGFLKLDGSTVMTGDLNLGTKKAINVGNGAAASDAVNKGQLDAAIAAGLGALGTYQYCRAHASADLTAGQSPRTFSADTNDAETTVGMHSTSSNKSRFVATQAGYYIFNARFKVSGFGGAGIQWFKNGSEALEGVMPPFLAAQGDGTTFIGDVLLVQLALNDYVEALVYGLSGPDSGNILQDSSVSQFLLSANGVGGGDLKSDGTVPMTADFDNGANKQTNMADGVAVDDGATVGQMQTADAALQAEIDALTVSGPQELKFIEAEFADGGYVVISSTDWLSCGPPLDLVLAAAKNVAIDAEGSAIQDGQKRANVQLGIQVQKVGGPPAVIYPGTYSYDPLGYYVNTAMTAHKKLALTTGTWQLTLVARKVANFPLDAGLYTSPDFPARIAVVYTDTP